MRTFGWTGASAAYFPFSGSRIMHHTNCGRMKLFAFIVVLVGVAVGAYDLGRRHARSEKETSVAVPATASNNPAIVAVQTTTSRQEVAFAPDSAPFAQNLTSAQRGYAAAAVDV